MPVAIDGMVVMPGDVVLGDEDGLLAFDRAVASELLWRSSESRRRARQTL